MSKVDVRNIDRVDLQQWLDSQGIKYQISVVGGVSPNIKITVLDVGLVHFGRSKEWIGLGSTEDWAWDMLARRASELLRDDRSQPGFWGFMKYLLSGTKYIPTPPLQLRKGDVHPATLRRKVYGQGQ